MGYLFQIIRGGMDPISKGNSTIICETESDDSPVLWDCPIPDFHWGGYCNVLALVSIESTENGRRRRKTDGRLWKVIEVSMEEWKLPEYS